MSPGRSADAMPCFLRRWVAKENHESLLRRELLRLHAAYVEQHDHLIAAVILRTHPDHISTAEERLTSLASDVVERFAPSRVLIHHAIDDPGLFFTICDARDPIDLTRYLGSSLLREHHLAGGSLLVERPRWFSLDPLWHYFRRQKFAV